MKIGQTPDIPVGLQGSTKPSQAAESSAAKTSAAAQATTQAQTTPVASQGASVTLSKAARSLGQSVGGADPDIDMDQVNEVRAAISNGTFKVDAGAIADKMLSNAQEMLNRVRR